MNLKFSSYSDCDATEFMMWEVQRNEASKELTRGQAKNDTTVGFGGGRPKLVWDCRENLLQVESTRRARGVSKAKKELVCPVFGLGYSQGLSRHVI